MNFFISDAMAQSGGQAANPMGSFIFIGIFFVIMYFMLIRPQQKRMKAHNELVSNLAVGDEVITNGGTLGAIVAVDDAFIKVEIAAGTEIHVQKSAVAKVLPKGTIKSLK
ncbi:preprotein translocase subunit YajC [Marinicella sp. S1101]|uniref:preprotein translocase subunit YajC n=1 Tax=Marinicella marina TaxID=2996016 RepID=UPI002260EE50|nr:preprotein translocase subunit YajC [Marinicella marina]MCX7553629.1 preprotein translocase subunit YajC [Marinicella marina]MDJ1140253.1 preprotein translocase subunit YajC [Marinicella marina]